MRVELRRPPASRYHGPVIDAHCHYGTPASSGRMIKAGQLYGVSKWMGICRIDQVKALRKRFGQQAGFSIWMDHREARPQPFVDHSLRIIEQAVKLRCHCIKFWYKPEFNLRTGMFFDDPRLDPIFQAISDAGLPVLVHIADPDIWWRKVYHDTERYETKKFTYRQLKNTLGRFPQLRVLVAHFGGWPENLPFLADILERYPNCFFDTSATKWIARELSQQPAEARSFMIRYADRLLFGSDLVAFKRADLDHHCSRYWVHRHLYESDRFAPSPIDDPDAEGRVHVAGLDLPGQLLARLYHDNACHFFRLNKLD